MAIGVMVTLGGLAIGGVQSDALVGVARQDSYAVMSEAVYVSSATMATLWPVPVTVAPGTYAFRKSEPMNMFTPVGTQTVGGQVGGGPEPASGRATRKLSRPSMRPMGAVTALRFSDG